jgi:hypothetical protein
VGDDYSEGPSSGGRVVVNQRMQVPQGGKVLSQTDRAVDSADNATDAPAQQPHRASKQ